MKKNLIEWVSLHPILKQLFLNLKIAVLIVLLSVTNLFASAEIINDGSDEDILVTEQQQARISGTITDASSGQAMPGVNIQVKGTTFGAISDVNGKYTIAVSGADITLVYSFIGYINQEIPAGGRTVIDVIMKEQVTGLDEVVVIGYGTARKATLTGSIAAVKGDDIKKAPVTNVSNTLVGKLAGLTSVQRSGEPGSDQSTIMIRGMNTLGDNSPLIVVDGVPGRSLNRIASNTIESITVLKDASAAIYGSEAANGVILVTTKSGTVGKPTITVNLNQGFNQPTRVPKMCDGSEYAILLNELDEYRGSQPRYTAEQIKQFTSGTDPWKYPNTDWYSEVLKPWSAQNDLNASMSGGTESFKYFIALGTKFQDGFYYNSATNFKQYDFRSNIDSKISKNVNLSFYVSGRLDNDNGSPIAAGSVFRTTTLGSPNIPAYWPDGTPGPDIIEGNNPVVVSTGAAGYDNDKVYTLNSTLKLDIKIPWIKGLALSASGNLDKAFQYRKLWQTPWYVNSWDGSTYDANNKPVLKSAKTGLSDARLTQYSYDNQGILLNGLVTYEKTLDRHAFKILAGMESIEGKGSNFNAFRRYYVSQAIDELFAGGTLAQSTGGSSSESGRLNYFGRVNYTFSEKILFEFVWRYDGSYIFPEEGRYGFFPGVSVGWRLSEENFWKDNLSFIDEFKVRASFGQTGNDRINAWQYLSSYAYRSTSTIYIFGTGAGQENKLLYESRIPNPAITWEVANQANIGFEGSLLNSKLSVKFDYFDNRRSNILWQRNASVPQSTGLTLPRENIGKVTNKGFEYEIGYQDQINKFRYLVSFNGGYAKNKVTFWDETPGRPEWQQSTGKPIPTGSDESQDLYYEAIGIFKDQTAVDNYPHWAGARPGDVIFRDVNDDKKIDGLDRVRNAKNNIPRFTTGLNIGLWYNQFDLSVLVQGATGALRYIATESGEIGNYLQDFYDNRWTSANPNSSQPRAFNRDSEYWRSNRNTQWLRKTDYLRLKTMELGYNLPESLVNKLGIGGLRIYVSGYNLLTLSPDLTDFDPETYNSSTTGQSQGYPVQRVINGGINLTF